MVCHVVSCCIMSCHDILNCVMSWFAVLCYGQCVQTLYMCLARRLDVRVCGHAMLWHVMSRQAMSRNAMTRNNILHGSMVCYVEL